MNTVFLIIKIYSDALDYKAIEQAEKLLNTSKNTPRTNNKIIKTFTFISFIILIYSIVNLIILFIMSKKLHCIRSIFMVLYL